ncbi:MAG: CBS domain-containing protein [Archaeoglobaceae archaeon]|nr:CBS domain-containing protein [Archaeoglobaceae archaeon]MDW8117668.1 CBS domain-containing protein [Archaeoglobaceae archaeon]
MRVEEIMNKRIEFVDPDLTVLEVIEKIVNKRIRLVVVKPKEKDYGVITIRDIVYKCLAKGRDPEDMKAYEIASKPLIAVGKGATVEDVLAIMEKSKIASVFVKDGDKIIGVVSLMDLMTGYLIGRLL